MTNSQLSVVAKDRVQHRLPARTRECRADVRRSVRHSAHRAGAKADESVPHVDDLDCIHRRASDGFQDRRDRRQLPPCLLVEVFHDALPRKAGKNPGFQDGRHRRGPALIQESNQCGRIDLEQVARTGGRWWLSGRGRAGQDKGDGDCAASGRIYNCGGSPDQKAWIVMSRDDVRRLMSESFAGSEFRRSVFE